jgi:hypothetical protein
MEEREQREAKSRENGLWKPLYTHAWLVNELAYQKISKEGEPLVCCGSYRLPGGENGEILAVKHSRAGEQTIKVEVGIIYDYNYYNSTKPSIVFTTNCNLNRVGRIISFESDIKAESIVENAITGKIIEKNEITGVEKERKIAEMSAYLLKAKRKELRETRQIKDNNNNPVVTNFLPKIDKQPKSPLTPDSRFDKLSVPKTAGI